MARCENAPKQLQGLSSQGSDRHDSQRSVSSLTIGDVMVDIDRSIGMSPSIDLNLSEERDRAM